jgi:cell filamentation protein
VLDIVAVLNDQDDYEKTCNYWKYLKAKLKRENSEVVSATTQLKLLAPDGKKRLTDVRELSDHSAIPLNPSRTAPNSRPIRSRSPD